MPRRPRVIVPNTPIKLIAVFILNVSMTNHVHLLVSAEKADAIGVLTNTLGHKLHEKKIFF